MPRRAETLAVVDEPSEIPGGAMATYRDPGGATIYVMDQSTDQGARVAPRQTHNASRLRCA